MADIQIDDGIIKILNMEVQDPKAAAILAEYPQVRWAEITRKAVKIGLGYLKGGEKPEGFEGETGATGRDCATAATARA